MPLEIFLNFDVCLTCRKYERAKALLENMKSNEDTLIRRDQEMMQRIQNRDKKIDLIKEKAQESIEKYVYLLMKCYVLGTTN